MTEASRWRARFDPRSSLGTMRDTPSLQAVSLSVQGSECSGQGLGA